MKIAKGMALIAGVAMAAQAGAAVRPAAANVQLAPGAEAAMRIGAPTRAAKQKLGGEAILPAVLAAGVVAGGIALAASDNGHSSSP